MKKSDLLKVFWVLVTSVVLICVPESSFAAGGHGGGGGGFHGGGGGGFHGGGFHGGGFGGYHGGWGGTGWHGGWGGYGWRGGGWGYPGWGWGVGIGFGWGWGSYWPSYPYGYGYPYYAYPYYPSYPYYGPDAYAPADQDRYNGGNPRDNSQQQNSSYPAPERSTVVSGKNPTMTFASHKAAGDTGSAEYWLANYQQHTVPRQAVRNVVQALLAMPPDARRRQIKSGRYRNFSPEEQEFLNQVAQGVGRVGERKNNADGTKPEGLRLASQ